MPGNQRCTVYIGNLDEKVEERVVYEIMVQAGSIVDFTMPRDKETNRHKGYAFAEYESEEVAQYAIKLFSGLVFLNRKPVRFGISGQDKNSGRDKNSPIQSVQKPSSTPIETVQEPSFVQSSQSKSSGSPCDLYQTPKERICKIPQASYETPAERNGKRPPLSCRLASRYSPYNFPAAVNHPSAYNSRELLNNGYNMERNALSQINTCHEVFNQGRRLDNFVSPLSRLGNRVPVNASRYSYQYPSY